MRNQHTFGRQCIGCFLLLKICHPVSLYTRTPGLYTGHLMKAGMKTVTVYCGSSFGNKAEFREGAAALGHLLAEKKIHLVYGGGKVGLMGTVARAALEGGGQVTGIILEALKKKEVALEECTELIVVDTMHERKAKMAELSDGFIAMPGGLGTLEEVFEAVTWQQLGIHAKPCGLLNISDYYHGLLQFLDEAVANNFILQPHRDMLLVSEDPAELLDRMNTFTAVHVDKAKWIRENMT